MLNKKISTIYCEFCDPQGKVLTREGRGLSIYEDFFCFLFVCLESHEQFFSYLATVTIAGDRDAKLDLCLALTAFSSF
jgi:hypothetical protein